MIDIEFIARKDRLIHSLTEKNSILSQALEEIRKMVDKQAEDEGIWFNAETAPEAYIQQEFRKLHGLIEHHTKGK